MTTASVLPVALIAVSPSAVYIGSIAFSTQKQLFNVMMLDDSDEWSGPIQKSGPRQAHFMTEGLV